MAALQDIGTCGSGADVYSAAGDADDRVLSECVVGTHVLLLASRWGTRLDAFLTASREAPALEKAVTSVLLEASCAPLRLLARPAFSAPVAKVVLEGRHAVRVIFRREESPSNNFPCLFVSLRRVWEPGLTLLGRRSAAHRRETGYQRRAPGCKLCDTKECLCPFSELFDLVVIVRTALVSTSQFVGGNAGRQLREKEQAEEHYTHSASLYHVCSYPRSFSWACSAVHQLELHAMPPSHLARPWRKGQLRGLGAKNAAEKGGHRRKSGTV